MQKADETRDVTAVQVGENQQSRTQVRDFAVDHWNLWFRRIAILSASLFLTDRLLKYVILSFAGSAQFGLLEFTKFMNSGMVFSIPVPQWFYIPLAISIFLIFAVYAGISIRKKLSSAFGLLFVVSGALSNLIDRISYGATIDYLVFFERSAVNLADGMILCGVILYICARRLPSGTNNT